ncbi:calcium-binding protein [Mesorhizobium sp. CN2-181]|uniref:calcium-binding protein n=1 Tax=Mesorhizobium yinganensis TaxID=3157707 RepID=UPI0032B87D94
MANFTCAKSRDLAYITNLGPPGDGVDMGELPFKHLRPADFQTPQVSYSDDQVEYQYGYGGSPFGRLWTFDGDFQFDLDEATSDVVDVTGTVKQLKYRTDIHEPTDPGGKYWTEYSISGFSVDVSDFQALSASALTALIFSGDDNIVGTSYDDVLLGFDGADVIKAGLGNDELDGGLGADIIYGGHGADTFHVDDSADQVIEYAGQGPDAVFASVTYALTAGSEVELLTTSDKAATDAINLTGNEFIQTIEGNAGVNQLRGGGRGDELLGLGGDDLLYGEDGSDVLIGGAGADYLNGGSGTDFASYATATAGVVVDMVAPASNSGDAAGDTFVSIEGIRGSGFDDELLGNAAANRLDGGSGADRLYGLDGDDLLTGGGGGDLLTGGWGTDTASYETSGYNGVIVDLFDPGNNAGDATGDEFSSIENVRGSNGDDVLYGNASANRLEGGEGGDRLFGREGNDWLMGGNWIDRLFGDTGDDILEGGSFEDYLSGGAGSDTASYATAGARVVAQLLTPANNEGDAAGDTYNSIEHIIGSDFDDGLVGTAGGNKLDGGKGADRIFGIDGNDILTGGEGADYLSGGLGTDTASYAAAAARVTVSLANPVINTGDAAGDTFNSIENLTGSAFDDYVYGNSAANVIKGAAGNDIVKGYAGNDTLSGGSGADIFVFNSALNAASNVDTVTDYDVAADTIWLDVRFFAALSTGTLAAAAFRKNATGLAEDADDRIVFNTDTGELFYDGDGNGASVSTLFAKLTAGLALTNVDFVTI